MQRRHFIKQASLGMMAASISLQQLKEQLVQQGGEKIKMPVLFIGHGSPMNAIEDNEYTRGWKNVANQLTKPKAVLCISAHWLTKGTMVTAMPQPRTIHDFGGFPQKLFDVEYKAAGSPDFAKKTSQLITKTEVISDMEWGLDHGTWSVLLPMYPKADIPVFQLSIDYTKPPSYHYELAKELKQLREEGVLIVSSGNIVHNLGMLRFDNKVYDWTEEFNEKMMQYIASRNHNAIVNYDKLGKAANYAVPTNEHFLPLIYSIALTDEKDPIEIFNNSYQMGSISMASVKFG